MFVYVCPQCGGPSNGYAFAGYSKDYVKCFQGHVWHAENVKDEREAAR